MIRQFGSGKFLFYQFIDPFLNCLHITFDYVLFKKFFGIKAATNTFFDKILLFSKYSLDIGTYICLPFQFLKRHLSIFLPNKYKHQ